MKTNTLTGLLDYGQSYWLDNLSRKKITSGEIKKRVQEEGLRGITSNPSIFNKAISNSTDYDEEIKKLVSANSGLQQIYDALTIKDVQDACDILRPVFDASKGTDGFVSLEVSPFLARNTERTMDEARRLYKAVNRPNCLIKIPGTKEGLPAIEQMLYEGININITLLFSIERYVQVAKAYVSALKRRNSEGKPVNNIASVASFFLSRIDTLTDQLLGHRLNTNQYTNTDFQPELLLGKCAVASARLAYQQFKQIFSGNDWENLRSKGAQVQRVLWASTSNKDPLYSDVRYVETLIGPDTVNTLPDETIDAFADHGQLKKNTIEENLEEAKQLFGQLKKLDIDIAFVTQQLENEGITKFADSFNELMTSLAEKRLKILGDKAPLQQINYGKLKKDADTAYSSLNEKQAGKRLFGRDPYLWKTEPEQIKSISNRLGWLDSPDNFKKRAAETKAFAEEVKKEGYKYAVLLGMGGSSLCSEVARQTFGATGGYLKLFVLDNTDPAAILDLQKQIELEKTIFLVASKSGNTMETLSFFHYFYSELEKKTKVKSGKNFVAITDAGTPLVKIGGEYAFRKVFVNQGDIGGRYSVLSDFGLVPMALMGIDISAMLDSAKQMEVSCDANAPAGSNAGISLGTALGICERHGRDKITFVLSPSIHSFGFWVEQLLAESTGKEGKGVIPVNGEELGSKDVYTNDRLFVHIYLDTDDISKDEMKLRELETAGHPVVRIKVPGKIALGGEYYRWEIATAIAGMIIGINPFDEPNVAESKANTNKLLEEWTNSGSFKKTAPVLTEGEINIYAGNELKKVTGDLLSSFIRSFASQAQAGDYIALLPYFMETDKRNEILQDWRQQLRDEQKVATTLLTGPRYLHSTGQLHKGGPATGMYILLIGDGAEDLPIPGQKFGFGTLHMAQALGDFRSLSDKGRRVIRIHLGKDIDAGLKKLWQSQQKGEAKIEKLQPR